MTGNNGRILGDRIERALNAEIARRMGTVSNPVLRAAIEDLLRDNAYDKILRAVSANPPRAIDIGRAVQESLDELSSSVKGLAGNALKSNFRLAGRSNDNGGKDDSGGKMSPPSRYDSGGKYDAGGKDDRPGYGGK